MPISEKPKGDTRFISTIQLVIPMVRKIPKIKVRIRVRRLNKKTGVKHTKIKNELYRKGSVRSVTKTQASWKECLDSHSNPKHTKRESGMCKRRVYLLIFSVRVLSSFIGSLFLWRM